METSLALTTREPLDLAMPEVTAIPGLLSLVSPASPTSLFFFSENDKVALSLTLSNIKRYSINGFLIEQFFQEDILDKDREEKTPLKQKRN